MKLASLERVIELLGWLATAFAGGLLLTQAVGWNGSTLLAALHALTPLLLAVTIPVAGAANWRKRHQLAIAASLVGLGSLMLAAPLVFAPDRPTPDPNGTGVSVAAVNLLFSNPVVIDAADDLLIRDADVILFTEYTAEHHAALRTHPIATSYPHKVERPGLFASGIALWSKYPLAENQRPATVHSTLDVLLDGPDGPLRLFGVHPPTPIFTFDGWIADLEIFGELGSAATEPTLIVGISMPRTGIPRSETFSEVVCQMHIRRTDRDFLPRGLPTSSFLHSFDLIMRSPETDSCRRLVQDFTVAGSDHRGFVVSVVPAR